MATRVAFFLRTLVASLLSVTPKLIAHLLLGCQLQHWDLQLGLHLKLKAVLFHSELSNAIALAA
jgi:hypothetical protein